MAKELKIFKSFEEQEQYHLEQMANTKPIQRFQNLYKMQQPFTFPLINQEKLSFSDGYPK